MKVFEQFRSRGRDEIILETIVAPVCVKNMLYHFNLKLVNSLMMKAIFSFLFLNRSATALPKFIRVPSFVVDEYYYNN